MRPVTPRWPSRAGARRSVALHSSVGLSDDALDPAITDRAKEVEHYVALRRRVEPSWPRAPPRWKATLEAAACRRRG